MSNLEFMAKFKPQTRCIKEFKYWIVCIRAKQVTLGDAVILLKREIPSVSEVNPEEAAEFSEVVKWYEQVCKDKFKAIKFNYLCMMMHDQFVHYHAFPRYDKEINIFNRIFEDKGDANFFNKIPIAEKLDEDTLIKIKEYMEN